MSSFLRFGCETFHVNIFEVAGDMDPEYVPHHPDISPLPLGWAETGEDEAYLS